VWAQEPVRAPAQEPGLAQELAQEPVREQAQELAQEPVREQAQELVREQAPVRLASSARLAQVRAPVCWRPAVQLAPDVRHFCRKHSKRRWPG
jgi:hypothetical protein